MVKNGFRQPKARRTPFDKDTLIKLISKEAKELLQGRGNLSAEDLEYVALAAARLKDERLKACIGELIGWGSDERARLETQIAIGIECMRRCAPSKFREAAQVVELRYQINLLNEKQEE